MDNLQFQEGKIHWNVIFTKRVQDWEMKVILPFFKSLYSFKLRQRYEDRIGWSPSKRCKFELKSFYQVLISLNGSFSLEEYMESQDSLAGGIFCVDTR